MYRIKSTIVIVFMLLNVPLFSQIDPDINARLLKRTHTFDDVTLPYRLYVPTDYSPDQTYPILLFLHGAMWAGTDNHTQLDNELALHWIDSTFQNLNPCFVVYPQIPAGQSWEVASGQVSDLPSPNLAVANDIITQLLQEFSIDENRVYACGKSIGAQGVYGLVARYPSRYAAAIPAAGRYVYQSITELAKSSWWIFHNRDDTTVPISQSRHIIDELENIGEHVVFTHCDFHTERCDTLSDTEIDAAIQDGARFMFSEFEDSGHQLEPNVVATFGLYKWTMAQSKINTVVSSPHQDVFRISNAPNPFNSQTTFSMTLNSPSIVSIRIYNIMGQLVTVLQDGWLTSGAHDILWIADENPSGLYFYELQAGSVRRVGRCLLLR